MKPSASNSFSAAEPPSAGWRQTLCRFSLLSPAYTTLFPSGVHDGALRAYLSGASHRGLTAAALDALVAPWSDDVGQAAFYRQIAQADEAYTDEVEPLYPTIELPTLVVWGQDDVWIPIDRAHRLCELIPDARLHLIENAGHLVQLDQPEALTAALTSWLSS